MNVVLIGVAPGKKKDEVRGFKLLDLDSKETMVASYDSVLRAMTASSTAVKGLEIKNGTLTGSNGAISRYPRLDVSTTQPLIILAQIYDVGYLVCDINGSILSIVAEDVINYAKKFGIANGKVVTRTNGTEYISPISGNYDEVKLKYPFTLLRLNGQKEVIEQEGLKKEDSAQAIQEVVDTSNSTKDAPSKRSRLVDISPDEQERKKNEQAEKLRKLKEIGDKQGKERGMLYPPIVRVIAPNEPPNATKDNHSAMTVEQKLVKSFLVLRGCLPFYYCILANVPKNATVDIDTMAVSVDEFFYNTKFVAELTLPELIFVDMHESMHIAYLHHMRQGKRIASLWNMACDFYINKLICDEYKVSPKGGVTPLTGDTYKVGIAFPQGRHEGLYNPKVNTKVDTVEGIYEELLQAYQQAKNNQSQSNQGQQGQQGQGQSGSGQGQGQQGQDQGQGQMGGGQGSQEQQNESGQGGGQNQGQQGQGQGGGGGQNQGQQGNGQSGQDEQQGQGQDSSNTGDAQIIFRGQKIVVKEGSQGQDIVDSTKSAGMSQTEKNEKVKGVLKKASIQKRQMTGTFGGEAGSFLERAVEEFLAPKVNWVALLKNKLTKASQTVMTYAKPDKRFISRGMTLPGPKKLENDTLSNIKVCIDTSGSISDQDLGIALNQISQLLKKFKAEAEVLYWDTQVREVAPFNNIQELIKIKPKGGGGTDVNCVFEHFNSRDYRIGKKQKPSIIIIFTDGYFGDVSEKYRRYTDTIWIINGDYYKTFKPPFGRKATLKISDC